MSLTTSDVNWLMILENFLRVEKIWNTHLQYFKEKINDQIFLRLDLFLKVLRRSLDSGKQRNRIFRIKFCSQMDGVAFLISYAEQDMDKLFSEMPI